MGMILAGIDEAGLGPVLGPLVVSAATFSIEDSPAEVDLWTRLVRCVARDRRRARRPGHVAIADSKKLYHRKSQAALGPLERGVLTMLYAAGKVIKKNKKIPSTLAELLDTVAPQSAGLAADYPWYGPCDLPLPHHAAGDDVELTGNAIGLEMRAAGVALLEMRAEPVFVGEFNRLITATQNKSTAALGVTFRLLMHLWRTWPRDEMRIVVDRQGGRVHYREALQKIFPDCRQKILAETDSHSAYLLYDGPRTVEIRFMTAAEQHSLPTALASMLSKYLRELFMELFNRFWAAKAEAEGFALAPTAGYYVDGRRFFSQIQPAIKRLGLDERQIYRSR